MVGLNKSKNKIINRLKVEYYNIEIVRTEMYILITNLHIILILQSSFTPSNTNKCMSLFKNHQPGITCRTYCLLKVVFSYELTTRCTSMCSVQKNKIDRCVFKEIDSLKQDYYFMNK